MGKSSLFACVFVLFCSGTQLMGQDRYAVHYSYKPTDRYSLNRPLELVSEASLERRAKENSALDSTDIPVSEKYIAAIRGEVQEILYHSKWLNASLVAADSAAVEKIASLPFVSKVVYVGRGEKQHGQNGTLSYTGNDPIFAETPSETTFDFQNHILGIPEMHADGFNGEGIKIAVFDAGFLNTDAIGGLQHLFNENRVLATRDFVRPGSGDVFRTDTHGTGALSLLASFDPSRLIGGAYAASYVLCITEDVDSEYRIEEYNWVRAAEFADSLGVQVINSSLGYNLFDDPEMNYSREDLDGETAVISIGAGMAANKGILVVSSSGNEGNISWQTITVPADARGILAVGAINNRFSKAGFSSIGPSSDGRIKPELVAYGSGVTLWRQVEGTSFSSGTSFSAPQIAALAAGLWQANPEWTRAELKDRLIQSGSQAKNPDFELGYGVPNYLRALYGGEEGTLVDVPSRVYPNPLDDQELFVEFGQENSCQLTLYDLQGKMISSLRLDRPFLRDPYRVDMGTLIPGIYWLEVEDNSDAARMKLWKK
ncbi:Por secretion system C-terminal sorting domain-containing protein [Cyclobacterium xiamenense]|uniref:Por secretion system C-terminal sorting domain-containing protein n=1 Tax=Cyclobacterium xiamenense TaxID=1297121 RepID=A0A1H6UC03_9BACT|nr:S8 family peptidase [Cyclobacterium xiamenense]SEI89943.1 Por secretion system C-terminal sorting domain-containing protein [Cyclobacterium xiamenense]